MTVSQVAASHVAAPAPTNTPDQTQASSSRRCCCEYNTAAKTTGYALGAIFLAIAIIAALGASGVLPKVAALVGKSGATMTATASGVLAVISLALASCCGKPIRKTAENVEEATKKQNSETAPANTQQFATQPRASSDEKSDADDVVDVQHNTGSSSTATPTSSSSASSSSSSSSSSAKTH